MGIVVDAFSGVYRFNDARRNPPSDFGGSTHVDFIEGPASVEDKMVALLNIDQVVNVGLPENLDQTRG